MRLFSYDFAIPIKPLPSTSDLSMQKPHAMSPQREFRLRPLKLATVSDNVLRLTKEWVTGQNMPSLQTYNKTSYSYSYNKDFVRILICSQELQC